ncbi:MAG TPA: metalloregulator ArsR/SmtB family transcription factor [Tepidisphaeraceae bacterium]|nr:metalloregulator ArsR/SmtB family transcription factor [Tepidisphaeraceae bacterium]
MFPEPQLIARVVQRLKALADENRIGLILQLRHGPANVTQLTRALGIAQASVSKHLSVLRQVGIVGVRRVGNQAVYSIRDESIFELCQSVCNGVMRFIEQEHAAIKPRAGAAGRSRNHHDRETSRCRSRRSHRLNLGV